MTPAEVIATVVETHKDTIGTHYPECWKYHVGCLAVLLRDLGADAPPKNKGEEGLESVDWEGSFRAGEYFEGEH